MAVTLVWASRRIDTRADAQIWPSTKKSSRKVHSTKSSTVCKAKLAQVPTQHWTKVSYKKRKIGITPKAKIELRGRKRGPKKRKVIFWRESGALQKSEEDLILVLNKSLQKTGASIYIKFCQVGYAQSGAILVLFKEKASAEDLVKEHFNILIKAVKSIDKAIIKMEVLEHWKRLKVYGISLARYFGEKKMKLLSYKIESSTRIKLKTIARWLLNKVRLKERLESIDGKRSAIVITMGKSTDMS